MSKRIDQNNYKKLFSYEIKYVYINVSEKEKENVIMIAFGLEYIHWF
jgi:hypothetical protein